MRIVALLTVRNEASYLECCVRHLHEQGVETCVIDNDSTDGSRQIAEQFLGRGVCQIERLRYEGYFDLLAQCRQQEKLAAEIDADWFIHHDADEIIEAPAGFASLAQAIKAVDDAGYNAINCDEFVFVPIDENQHFEYRNYVGEMKHYYFFEPAPVRLVRMWRRHPAILLHQSGGHGAVFPDRRIFATPFILRHYIGLSADYLRAKYSQRVYSDTEVRERGWHGWRAKFTEWRVSLPSTDELKVYRGDGVWDKSQPKTMHQFVVRQL
jgi:glycosyltransferase involved in cell wall biosynthesis